MDSVVIEPNVYYLEHKAERITYQKIYNRENTEKIKEYQQKYYERTREEKLKKQQIYNSKKSECTCGKIITQSNKSSNLKSKNTSNSTEEEDSDEDDESEEDSQPKKTYEDIQKEKQQYLFELERLNKQGYTASKKYSMASSFEELKYFFH